MGKRHLKIITALAFVLVLTFGAAAYAAPDETQEPSASATQSIQPDGTEMPQASKTALPAKSEPPETGRPMGTASVLPDASFFSEDSIPSPESISITSLAELQKIGQDEAYPLDASYVLANDIDADGAAFAPIGSASAPFAGTLDGGGHTVAGLNISGSGLFAQLTGTVRSMELRDISVKADGTAGVLAGTISGAAEVLDVFITGNVEAGEAAAVGGLAGSVENAGKIQNAQAYVTVSGTDATDKLVGALIGSNKAASEVYSGCVWSAAYMQQAFGLDSAVSESEGTVTLKETPSYVTLMTGGKSTQVTADVENAAALGLEFQGWICGGGLFRLENGQMEMTTLTSGNDRGAENLVAVYEKMWADQYKTQIRFPVPVIVSENTGGQQQLEPVDPIFPTVIEQIMEIKTLDSVFPTLLDANIRITKDPSDIKGNAGEQVTFCVEAQGADVLYQWQVSTDGGGTWADIQGATQREYTFTAAPEDDGKQFRCAVNGK